jgi:hypothetical protein
MAKFIGCRSGALILSIILLKHMLKLSRLYVNRRKSMRKGKNLNLLFNVKKLEWLRFNLLKLIIYSSQILFRHIVNM